MLEFAVSSWEAEILKILLTYTDTKKMDMHKLLIKAVTSDKGYPKEKVYSFLEILVVEPANLDTICAKILELPEEKIHLLEFFLKKDVKVTDELLKIAIQHQKCASLDLLLDCKVNGSNSVPPLTKAEHASNLLHTAIELVRNQRPQPIKALEHLLNIAGEKYYDIRNKASNRALLGVALLYGLSEVIEVLIRKGASFSCSLDKKAIIASKAVNARRLMAPSATSLGKDTSKEGEGHCGWLLKQGIKFKTWRKRWMVLSGLNIFYYRTQRDNEPVGNMPLLSTVVYGKAADNNSKKFTFLIWHESRRVFYLQATNKEEMEDWVNAIRSVIPTGGVPTEKQLIEIKKIEKDIR